MPLNFLWLILVKFQSEWHHLPFIFGLSFICVVDGADSLIPPPWGTFILSGCALRFLQRTRFWTLSVLISDASYVLDKKLHDLQLFSPGLVLVWQEIFWKICAEKLLNNILKLSKRIFHIKLSFEKKKKKILILGKSCGCFSLCV